MSTRDSLVFGLGSLHLLLLPRSRQQLLRVALDSGIRHFDVAPMYGNGLNERELGHALVGIRHEVTIATKFGIPFMPYGDWSRWFFLPVRSIDRFRPGYRAGLLRRDYSRRAMQGSVEASLRRLKTDYIDYLLLHEPPESASEVPLAEIEGHAMILQEKGMVRELGVAGQFGATSYWSTRPTVGLIQAPVPAIFSTPFAGIKRGYGLFRFYQEQTTTERKSFPEFVQRIKEQAPETSFVFSTKSPARLRQLTKVLL